MTMMCSNQRRVLGNLVDMLLNVLRQNRREELCSENREEGRMGNCTRSLDQTGRRSCAKGAFARQRSVKMGNAKLKKLETSQFELKKYLRYGFVQIIIIILGLIVNLHLEEYFDKL